MVLTVVAEGTEETPPKFTSRLRKTRDLKSFPQRKSDSQESAAEAGKEVREVPAVSPVPSIKDTFALLRSKDREAKMVSTDAKEDPARWGSSNPSVSS
jgi:hypothetical protein